MKKIILTIVIMAGLGAASAQQINVEKTFGGYKFTQDGKNLKLSQIVDIVKNNEEAYQLAKSAKSNYTIAQIIGGAGGFMIGWPIGAAVGGGDPNWTMAGIGAGLVAISIPFNSGANKKMKKAIEHYNSNLQNTSSIIKPQYRFVANTKGVGIAIVF